MATQLEADDRNQQTGTAVATMSPAREAYAIVKDQASRYALSNLLPDAIRGNSVEQAMANCLIALQMAEVMNELPFVVMQNIHIVKGKAGFATKFVIARANRSGVFRGRLNWRVDKSDAKNLSVTCFAVLADTGEEVEFTVDMAMAQAEGWTSNTKYKSMPEVMLRYRSAAFLIRFYAEDVMLGYHTAEENEDVGYASNVVQMPANRLTGAMLIEQANGPAPEQVDPETGDVVEARIVPSPARAQPIEQSASDTHEEEAEAEAAEPTPAPSATYVGEEQPEGASRNETWWNGEKLRYAHATAAGIKWYLKPQADAPAPAEEPLDPYRGEPWAEKRREIVERFAVADTMDDWRAADAELQRHVVSFPDEIATELNSLATVARRRINDAARETAD